jgi:hypothetical protein
MMSIKASSNKGALPFLGLATLIYGCLIARDIVHLLGKEPWPGFTVAVNFPIFVLFTALWVIGLVALWVQKTWLSRLLGIVGVLATLAHGAIVRVGASNSGSPAGYGYAVAALLLAISTFEVFRHKAAIDRSAFPGVEPDEQNKDQASQPKRFAG